MNLCACGCGTLVKKTYKHGHNLTHKPTHLGKLSNSTNRSTMYTRSNKLRKNYLCSFEYLGQCKGRAILHHMDEDITNNTEQNLLQVCTSHHNLIHSGKFDPANPKKLDFYTCPCGSRRYAKWKGKPKGEAQTCSKLKNEDVLEIRKLLSEGHTGVFLAKKFNISRAGISRIRKNKSWTHV